MTNWEISRFDTYGQATEWAMVDEAEFKNVLAPSRLFYPIVKHENYVVVLWTDEIHAGYWLCTFLRRIP